MGDFITVKRKYQKKTKDRKVIQQRHLGDLNNLDVNTVHEKSDPNELTITIDSVASENVISEEFGLQVKVRASQGHRQHAGDGREETLMSVARICDAGHQVVFQSGGGYIKHTGSGQITKFNRVDNVYRLKVSVAQPGFSGQGPQ